MYVGTIVQFMLCGGASVQKNVSAMNHKWYRNIITFNGDGGIGVKRVVVNRNTIVSQLIGVSERMPQLGS